MLLLGRPASLFSALALLASCSSLVGLDNLESDEDDVAGAGGRLIEPMTGGESGTSGGSAGADGEGGEGATEAGGQGGGAGDNSAGEPNGGAAGSAGEAGGGGTGGTIPDDCTEITVTYETASNDLVIENSAFEFSVTPDIAGAGPDILAVEFYWYSGLDGKATGTFQIEDSEDAQFATCARCVRIQDQLKREYLAISGTVAVDEASQQGAGWPIAILTDLTLIEVTINEDTYLSTPVPNGKCFHVASIVLDKPPQGWDCDGDPTGGNDLAYYLDGECDCGCGVLDADCASATATCDEEWCNGQGPDPSDNSQCL